LTWAQEKKLDAKQVEFFESKIRPVLVQQCYQCHSEEAAKNKKLRGHLLLDSKAGVLKGGDSGIVVVPGKSAESLLIKALKHVSDDLKMPPKGKLPNETIADFAKWIDMGAPDPRDGTIVIAKKQIDIVAGKKYWAFAPLNKTAPPQVNNAAWARTPIDRFILAKLEEKKLTPNTPIGKEKLIRRAYYDLLGLPPTPAEIDAFLQDKSATAYEQLIDRLLQSDHYGERWARHWLDLARFAESSGYEFDGDRPSAYPYRDFVIKALNDDMPYDQFVRWQVAGDQLEPYSIQAMAATGFVVSGPYPGQTTSKTLATIRYNHLDDMVATLSSAMLGMSVGCARCHDHKYDPIPQEDYYRLVSCFARTDSTTAQVDTNPEGFKKAKAAFDLVHNPLLAARDAFEKEKLPGKLKEFADLLKTPTAPWFTLEEVADPQTKKAGNSAATGKDGKELNKVHQVIAHTYLKDITAIRIDAGAGKFVPVDLVVTAAAVNGKVKETPVKMQPLKASADAVSTALLETVGANGFDGGMIFKITLNYKGELATAFKISITTTPRPVKLEGPATPQRQGEILTLLAREKGALTPKNRDGVVHWLRVADPEMDKIYQAVEESAKKTPVPKTIPIFAAQSNRGGDVNFLIRGEVDKKGPIAQPGFVQVLMNSPELEQHWTAKWDGLPSPSGKKSAPVQPRVALANWLTDADQGAGNLLARVMVNRLWQHHFGRGIVATPNDFGVQGEPPTHPELLDYLAQELIKNGWKLKAVHKLIMTSAVYMQDGIVNPANMQTDPQNRYLWRRPARRLEAEAIRDALLAVSGTLDKTMFGPGTLDANNLRRSVYLKVKRSQMVPLMQMFDAPEAQQSIGERTVTTVATQSLAFMNSPLVRRSAEKFAQRIAGRIKAKSTEGVPEAVGDAYQIALGRAPTTEERSRMVAFIETQAVSYAPAPQAMNQALTDFCQVMLCLNEFVYVD